MRHLRSARGGAYAAAVILCGVALCAKLLAGPLVLPGAFSLFLPAVLLAAWAGGIGPGLLATALSTVLALAFVMPHTPAPDDVGWVPALRSALFVTIGVGISTLVGSLRSAQRRLSVTEQRFRTLVDSVADYAIFLVDVQGRIVTWNVGAERLYRWRATEIVGDSLLRLWPGAALRDAPAETLLAEAARTGQATQEAELLRSDGSRFWAHVLVTPVYDEQGGRAGYSVITRDVTERRRTLAALQAARDQLEARVAARTEDLSRANRRLRDEVGVRRAAEAALRASEERFAGAFREAPYGMAIVGLDGRPVQVNRALCTMLGYDEADLLRMTFDAVTHPDDRDGASRLLAEWVRGEAVIHRLETRYVHRDGPIAWGALSCSLVRAPDGAPLHIVAQVEDISARKQADAALRESEERFAIAFENAPSGMALVRLTGQPGVTWTNRAFRQMLGSDAGLLDRPFLDVVYSADRDAAMRDLYRLVNGETNAYQAERRVVHTSGRVFWALVSVALVRADDGSPLYLISQVQDINARKQAEEELRANRERLQLAVSSANDGLWDWNLDEDTLFVSRRSCEIVGLDGVDREMVPGDWMCRVHPDDVAMVAAAASAHFDGHSPHYQCEHRLRHEDGSYRWVLARGLAVRDATGRPVRLAVVMSDVTGRKEAEIALRASEQHYRELITHVSDGLLTIDAGGIVTAVNPTVEAFSGYRDADLCGHHFLGFVHAEDREIARDHFERVRAGSALTAEYRVVARGGARRVLRCAGRPTPMADGTIGMRAVLWDVTEQRLVAAAVAEREAHFRALLEHSSDVVLVFDRQANAQYVGPSVTRLIGYQPVELLGPGAFAAVHPDDQDRVRAAFADLAASPPGRTGTLVYRVRARSGAVRWVEAVAANALGTPRIDAVVLHLRDITDRQQAEVALRASEEKYRELVENLNDVLFTVDRDGVFTYMSPAVRHLTGHDPEEVVGCHFSEFVLPQYAPALAEDLVAMLAGGPAEPAEFEVHTRQGAALWVSSLSRPILVDGAIVGLRGRFSDISARRTAEEVLRESEAKFRSLAESTAATIFIQRGDRLLYVNPSAEALTGYTTAELLQVRFWDLIDPRFREQAVTRGALRLRGEHAPPRSIVKIVRRDGETRWVDFTVARIEYAGQPAVLGTVIDITERKAAEREARQRQAELAHVLRVGTMGEMAASLAHELNQPLQAVVNFATGCMRRLDRANGAAADLLDPLNQIAAEALRAGEIVRRIRQFVRKVPARRERADVNELVLEATRIFEPEAALDDVTVRVGVTPDLPPVDVDAIQIEQVILNLLRNGLEAMASSQTAERILRIETSADDAGGVRVLVRDTGHGFAPDLGERLFEPFYTTKPQGLGMGLSISRSIIEAHGGRLFGSSRPGAGAEFGFVLNGNSQRGASYAA